jgi:hypothetical protein
VTPKGIRAAARSGITAVLLAVASGCSVAEGITGGEEPPESIYTQAEAYPAMEAAVAETVAVLPEFPGFEARLWLDHPCSHNGVDDPDYRSVEIEYQFSEANAQTPLVRDEYVEVLRDHWTEAGYEITLDDQLVGADRTERSLIAYAEERELELFYRVAYTVSLVITSGCMPVSELGEFAYVPPQGGIEPGSQDDFVDDFFPEGIPTEATT